MVKRPFDLRGQNLDAKCIHDSFVGTLNWRRCTLPFLSNLRKTGGEHNPLLPHCACNPRPGKAFSITRPGRGGRCDPPGVPKLSVVALREKDQPMCLATNTSRLLKTSNRDWLYVFDPRSMFDSVIVWEKVNFRRNRRFFLQVYKTNATQLSKISP